MSVSEPVINAVLLTEMAKNNCWFYMIFILLMSINLNASDNTKFAVPRRTFTGSSVVVIHHLNCSYFILGDCRVCHCFLSFFMADNKNGLTL